MNPCAVNVPCFAHSFVPVMMALLHGDGFNCSSENSPCLTNCNILPDINECEMFSPCDANILHVLTLMALSSALVILVSAGMA